MAVGMEVSQGMYVSTNSGLHMNGGGGSYDSGDRTGSHKTKQNKTRYKVASFENLCFSADKARLTHPFLPATVAAMGLAPFPPEHPCLDFSPWVSCSSHWPLHIICSNVSLKITAVLNQALL